MVGATPGLYVQFESLPGIPLRLESLEDARAKIELVAVQDIVRNGASIQLATVFVPDGKIQKFITKLDDYATKTTAKGEPRHKELVDRIASLQRATLRALWTDTPDTWPAFDEVIWWEVWLRRQDGHEVERLRNFAAQQVGDQPPIEGAQQLAFTDRIVTLIRTTAAQLSSALDVLNDIAEVRRAKETPSFFMNLGAVEQAAWAADLVERTSRHAANAPAVCVLDTGVTRAHPLLERLIDPADAMAVDARWGGHDNGGGPSHMGHGTEMLGLAGYGDLTDVLAASGPVVMRHRLESVKILPPTGTNRQDLYGAITAQAVALPEIQSPLRTRAFSLAITADPRDRGQPTSWSAAIDALSAGRSFDPITSGLVYLDEPGTNPRRLFVISAGNHSNLGANHLDRSDRQPVHDPAQAWNALTVGAVTERAVIRDPRFAHWRPVSPPGELSPWSTTSVDFAESWPLKPDVVFEGGNSAHDGTSFEDYLADLTLLTTHYQPATRLFSLSNATSAATAQVARHAAIIHAEYPNLWPETVRGLIVHSARWTPAMEAHLPPSPTRRHRVNLTRRYGAGVPSLERALRSANDSLTLIVESTIRPFTDGKLREMHVHDLPWPRAVLAELGSTPVTLRVTLSYFIEPNPGRRGWKRRHRYASHGLRFAVRQPTQNTAEFRKHLNKTALDEEEARPTAESDVADWFLGDARNKGSLHTDTMQGFAVDLAERGVIAIYPVSGWWKDQPKRDRSEVGARYALIVTIETEAQDVDIWTPVEQQIATEIVVPA